MLELKLQGIMLLQLLLSIILGGILGFEREFSSKNAGIRTFSLVCAGSCLFGILSIYLPPIFAPNVIHNPARIAAQVVSGIGFIGAGLVFHEGHSVRGLTTAASLWACAAIGVAISFSLYLVAIGCTLMLVFMLYIVKLKIWNLMSPKQNRHHLE